MSNLCPDEKIQIAEDIKDEVIAGTRPPTWWILRYGRGHDSEIDTRI